MKRLSWIGWLLAGLMLMQTTATGLATPASTNPLEGRLLEHSNGNFYVYHDGVKFTVQPAGTGDRVIDAIPSASEAQWDTFFAATTPERPSIPSNLTAYPSS